MRCLSVLLFCGLLLAVAIALADAVKTPKTTTLKQMKKNAKVGTSKPLAYKGKAVTTKKKKKKATTKTITDGKSTVKKRLTTALDEYAPDSELGTDCYDACYPNSTYFDKSGKILNPSQYGDFVDNQCGKTYLFGHYQVTWKENWKTCCALGMTPVLFDTDDEKKCLHEAVLEGKLPIEGDTTFWTGGFKHELNNMWAWCTKDSPLPIVESMAGEINGGVPSNTERKRVKSGTEDFNCLQKTLTADSLEITSAPCDARFNLACESVEKFVADLLPDTKCKAKCSTQKCTKNGTLFRLNEQQDEELKERYKYGRWVSKCGRYFLFSEKKATYAEARQKCCSYGTNLLSIKTAAKRSCLTRLTKEYPDIAGDFWTSGTDKDCDGNFRWCSVDRAFLKKEVSWGTGEPKQTKGDCVWLRTHVSKSSYVYTENCEAKKKFVCEVRQSGTTVEAVQRECVDLLGLTPGEVDGLNNTGNYTYKMKCYLRCIGDNLGMLVNGSLEEGNVMRLMEKSNEQGDVDKGYDAIDKCKTFKDPTDDCQSAYQMYKCGKEEAPVVFGKMVVWEEVSSKEEKAPVEITVQRSCAMLNVLDCRANPQSELDFAANKTTQEGGTAVKGYNGKTWYKSPYADSYTYQDAYQYCCSLKMHLPFAATYEDFVKLYDFMNGSNTDNFFIETYVDPKGVETWCYLDQPVPIQASINGFKNLRENSVLYTKKGFSPKYKLIPIRTSHLETDVRVHHFYCQPDETI